MPIKLLGGYKVCPSHLALLYSPFNGQNLDTHLLYRL